MKRLNKSMEGVTLLEIMLVLAIAAMVIVMSIRYYQSASSSQQANSVLQQIQSITAAADGLAQATGSFGSASNAGLQPVLPANSLTTPWGTAITVTSGTSTYAVSIANTPIAVCTLLKSKLAANSKYVGAGTNACSAVAAFTYTYNPGA